jgi:hypothetical protein
MFRFTTPRSGTDWSPSIADFGDFGDFGNDDAGHRNIASKPEQVHLSWHGDATKMWVTWVTQTPGESHDQADAEWIVIRRQLRGHNDTPFGPPWGSGRPLGVFCMF